MVARFSLQFNGIFLRKYLTRLAMLIMSLQQRFTGKEVLFACMPVHCNTMTTQSHFPIHFQELENSLRVRQKNKYSLN